MKRHRSSSSSTLVDNPSVFSPAGLAGLLVQAEDSDDLTATISDDDITDIEDVVEDFAKLDDAMKPYLAGLRNNYDAFGWVAITVAAGIVPGIAQKFQDQRNAKTVAENSAVRDILTLCSNSGSFKQLFHLQALRELGQPPRSLGEKIARRNSLCRALYGMLENANIVQIRGNPASGKSTLLSLFHQYLNREHPDIAVYPLYVWPEDDFSLDPLKKLTGNPRFPDVGRGTYILIDEAQTTYENGALWEELKNLSDRTEYPRVALFCSYGSRISTEDNLQASTPMSFASYNTVTLYASNPPSGALHGLLFTPEEYEEVVTLSGLLLEKDLRDVFYKLSGGHIGMIRFLLDCVANKIYDRRTKSKPFTLAEFYYHYPNHELARMLPTSMPGRGLPSPEGLRSHNDKNISNMFRLLLRNGTIVKLDSPDMTEAIDYAHSRGWIYYTAENDSFVIASPFHVLCISWILDSPTTEPGLTTLRELVFEVIAGFKPSQIFLPYRAVGPPSQSVRSTEYTYQAEFYRSLHDCTHGGVRLTAEFVSGQDANLPGRLDFLIPFKKWGVELTREGSQLEVHWQRFQSGAYKEMRDKGIFDDYALVDCRTTFPQKCHPDMTYMIHAIFSFNEDKSGTVEIWNHNHKVLKRINLLGNK